MGWVEPTFDIPSIQGYIPKMAFYRGNNTAVDIVPWKVAEILHSNSTNFTLGAKNVSTVERQNVVFYAYIEYEKII